MSFHVYILYSKKLDRFYVGQTVNLKKRLIRHNAGESSYTAAGIPWILLWSSMKPSLEEAEKLERKLKNLNRNRKLKFIEKYAEEIADLAFFEELRIKLINA